MRAGAGCGGGGRQGGEQVDVTACRQVSDGQECCFVFSWAGDCLWERCEEPMPPAVAMCPKRNPDCSMGVAVSTVLKGLGEVRQARNDAPGALHWLRDNTLALPSPARPTVHPTTQPPSAVPRGSANPRAPQPGVGRRKVLTAGAIRRHVHAISIDEHRFASRARGAERATPFDATRRNALATHRHASPRVASRRHAWPRWTPRERRPAIPLPFLLVSSPDDAQRRPVTWEAAIPRPGTEQPHSVGGKEILESVARSLLPTWPSFTVCEKGVFEI